MLRIARDLSIDENDIDISFVRASGPGGQNVNKLSTAVQLRYNARQLVLPDDAAIITLFYMGEQSLDEIGNTLGIEPNTVKVKLFRARQRLKEKLERNLKHEVKELI